MAAGDATTISRVIPGTNTGNDNTGATTSNTATRVTSRGSDATNSANSTAPTGTASTATASRSAVVSRVVGTSNTATTGVSAATPTRSATPSRATAASSAQATSARSKLDTAVNTVGRNARTADTGINSTAAVRRAGLVLRPSTAEVGGRAKIAGTNVQTGSNVGNSGRGVQSRAATTTVTRESIADAKDRMQTASELNDACQTQYNDCMDQFCAVIDANQKRCSCSANLARYAKVESAVKEANTQLNDVAQRIRYVGLSADEIRAIMTATEAEEALSGTTDTTETRNMLADIEAMIKNPTSTTSTSGDGFSTLDLNLDFSSNASDLFNLDFLNQNSSNFSSLRGTDLYNAAKKRCNTVLTQCKSAGADTEHIVANYDLAVDKDCITYEQGLNKMNETLVSNVRSANLMLQKARLAVMQNKNEYDAKGCIAALDACMTDDMVCGDGYIKCLDPTKQFIDENGNVVLGQDITNIIDFMNNYNNAQIDSTYLGNAANTVITQQNCAQQQDGKCVVKYLMTKIGTGANVSDNGLCRAVLDKCQRYTYSTSGVYNPYNDIVVNYIQRAMVNIKAAQQKIISDYASNCMLDIATCYNQQVTQVNAWSSNASVSSIRNVMRGACRNVALTCAYAVFAADQNSCPVDNPDTCLNSVSEMFYQSMLCPDNSIYDATGGSISTNDTDQGFVNAHCRCKPGYVVWGSSCITKCENGASHDSYGACPTSSSSNTSTRTCTVGTFTSTKGTVINGKQGGYVSDYCKCASNETVYNGQCVLCGDNQTFNLNTGKCEEIPEVGGSTDVETPDPVVCPDHSDNVGSCDASTNLRCVTDVCECESGFVARGGSCVQLVPDADEISCPAGATAYLISQCLGTPKNLTSGCLNRQCACHSPYVVMENGKCGKCAGALDSNNKCNFSVTECTDSTCPVDKKSV